MRGKSLRVFQRRRAREDILEIITYIASDNPNAARSLFTTYAKSLALLGKNPDIGWAYPSDNPNLAGLRAFPIGRFRSYLIFYRRHDDRLEVIRVLHGMRDLEKILREEAP